MTSQKDPPLVHSTYSPCPPARYFPLEKGIYEVSPGLHPFGFDFGNGVLDQCIFQFDSAVRLFLENKQVVRRENLNKYYVSEAAAESEAQAAAVRFLITRLCQEWPAFFSLSHESRDWVLDCRLSRERLRFSHEMEFLSASPLHEKTSELCSLWLGFQSGVWDDVDKKSYVTALDALASQFPEDVAIVSRDSSGRDALRALHVCAPSHWAPAEKIGLDFAAVHAPVPGFERMARASEAMVSAMIHKGPYVRFVWSFVTDTRLNHHPAPPPGWDADARRGRSFDRSRASENPFHLRVERQVTWGLPEANSALFFIRVSFIGGREIKSDPHRRAKLVSTLRSMSPQSRQYKGILPCWDELLDWLES